MNSKNRAERLRAPLCLKKEGQDQSKLFACDTVRTQHVTQTVSTMQTTCIDGLLSSGGDQNLHLEQGSQALEIDRFDGADSAQGVPIGDFIFDERLSWRARGVLAYCAANPDFVVTQASLKEITGPIESMGREKAADIINELIVTGYIAAVGRDRLIYLKQPITEAIRQQVFERDGHRCVRCQSTMRLSADHVVPERAGGRTTLENLQTLCMPCNNEKGTKAWESFAR